MIYESYEEANKLVSDNIILLHIGDDKTELIYSSNELITLPFGDKMIAEKYFKSLPPTEAEIEYAIQEIEDELMIVSSKVIELNSKLFTLDEKINELLAYAGRDGNMSIADLEGLFSRFAAIVTGRPASTDILPLDNIFNAYLLILREILHHLKFENIKYIEKV